MAIGFEKRPAGIEVLWPAAAAVMLLLLGSVSQPCPALYAAPRRMAGVAAQTQKPRTKPATPGAEIITVPPANGQQQPRTSGKPHMVLGAWRQFQCSQSIVRRAVTEAEQGTTSARMSYLSAQASAAASGSTIEETCRTSAPPPAGFSHAALRRALARYRVYLPRVTTRLSADAKEMAKVRRELSQTCYLLLVLPQEEEHLKILALDSKHASKGPKQQVSSPLPAIKGVRDAEHAQEKAGAKVQADLEAIGRANGEALRTPGRVDALFSQLLQSKVGAHPGQAFGPSCHLGTTAR